MTAQELINIIKAFDEGKTIQYYLTLGDKWTDIPKDLHTLITWVYNDRTLRIKPEPREWHIILNKDGDIIDHYNSADTAFYAAKAYTGLKVVHVREVMPKEEENK